MAVDSALGPPGQRPGVCTSSTRPANPYEGQVIYETDTDKTLVWNGSVWLIATLSDEITRIIKLSQAEYDALTPDANTLYVIVG